MEVRNRIAGALMGVTVKGVAEAREPMNQLATSIQESELCWENMVGWALAGFLGAAGATLFNMLYKKLIKKRINAQDQNISTQK